MKRLTQRWWPWAVLVACLVVNYIVVSWTPMAEARAALEPVPLMVEGQNATDPLGTQLAVQCLTTATLMPAAALNMNGRAGIGAHNKGPNTIYIGYNSSVTTSTGWPVPSNGSLTLALSWNKAVSAQQLYCIAETASQVSPADTRVTQVR